MQNEATPTQKPISNLMAQTFALVRACPEGRVTTYGWLAKALGYPRGARMVGWFMHEAIDGVPAQRVINSKGELSGSWAFGPPDLMRELLEDEGIHFTDEGRVDLKRYGWDPSRDLSPEECARIVREAAAALSTPSPSPHLLDLMHHDVASPFKDAQ